MTILATDPIAQMRAKKMSSPWPKSQGSSDQAGESSSPSRSVNFVSIRGPSITTCRPGESLVRGARLDTVELAVYGYGRDGWSICGDGDELPSGLYQDGGIPGA